jgi:hypothetical protein
VCAGMTRPNPDDVMLSVEIDATDS